ncbi:hypothetical protein [Cerasicoccus maritimus]|uniref:hypothetical protein n=1 Tax=Cerasicoccus maritimus TaxID=490089 RepID=UPI002852982C|nr:hypothetical protein [Cerasicoccus maritimus]
MVLWIRSCAWVLIFFAAPGVVYSLVKLDWVGLLINVALIAIGVVDLRNLRIVERDAPRGWRRIIYTQFLLGLLIGVSFAYAGVYLVKPEYWEQAREILEKIQGPVPDYIWDDAVARSQAILKWGTLIGGEAIFLGQVRLCFKINRLARRSQPPQLPADSSSEKH